MQHQGVTVYGALPFSSSEEWEMLKERSRKIYLYMVKLIDAEVLNPESGRGSVYEDDFDYNWAKKIASLDTDVETRLAIIEYFEKVLK